MSVTRKKRSEIVVETVPEDIDNDDEPEDDPSDNEEMQLNQGTQHSQGSATLDAYGSDDDEEALPESSKMSTLDYVKFKGSQMTFDETLDTFMSHKTEDTQLWNKMLTTWENDIEDIGLVYDEARYPDSFDEGTLSQTFATLGNKWTDNHEMDYMAKELSAMDDRENWIQQADEDMLNKDAIPRAYLARTSQKDHFTVLHSRGKIRTPNSEEEESELEGTWVAFTGNNALKGTPGIVSLGKSPATTKLHTTKPATLATIYEILNEPAGETGCFSGAEPHHEKFNQVPSLLPLPWKWAAAIAEHPDWTVQRTSRYIMFACQNWNKRPQDRETMGTIMRFLMGATTGKTATAKKTNPKVLLPTTPCDLDEPATAWMSKHQASMWSALANTPRNATPPRARANRKQTPRTGAPNQTPTAGATNQTPTAGAANQTPTAGAPGRAKRPATNPPPVANKRTTRRSAQRLLPMDPPVPVRPPRAPPPPSPPAAPPAAPPTPPPLPPGGNGIITPELVAALQGQPDTLKLIVDQICANQAHQAQQQQLQTAFAAINTVAATAIKEAHAAGSGPTSKGKWNAAKQARYAGFAGLAPNDAGLKPFFKSLISAASDDKDAIIQELLNALADKHEVFLGWEAMPTFFEDLKKLALRPGRTWKDFFRGLSPAAFADRDQAELQQAREQVKLHARYTIHLNGAEAERLEAKAPPMPAAPEKLQLYIKRWTIFLEETLGDQCELVIHGKRVYKQWHRLLPRIISSQDFMARRGNSILWELALITDDFFKQVITMQAFDEAAEDGNGDIPRAKCTVNIQEILTLNGPAAGDLPRQLRQYQPPPNNRHNADSNNNNAKNRQRPAEQRNNGGNNGPGGNSGGNRTSSSKGTWPEAFQNILGMYSAESRRRISLTRLLKAADTDRAWLMSTLGMEARCCCSQTILGQCPDTCMLRHDFVVDPAKAKIVANKLKSAVAVVTTERNISRA